MKKDTHPVYRPVVFQDYGAGYMFLTRSTLKSNDTVEFEGKTYPLIKVDISSKSHPFFTGKQVFIDTAGRVDRFQKKFGGTYSFQKGTGKGLAAPAKEAVGGTKKK